jgi:hypothetical protein
MRFCTGIFFCFFFITVVHAQNIESFDWKKPVKVSGGLSFNNVFYASTGMAARRDPYFWMLSGNVNLNLFGVLNVPISGQISQQNRSYTQPFNQFGISPYYKSWTVHAGYRSLQYSNYSVGGNQWLGGGVEYNPSEGFMGSVFYGRFQKKVNEFQSDGLVSGTPAYERWGYGTKMGFRKSGNEYTLSVFKGSDQINSVNDSIAAAANITPSDNVVWALTLKQKISRKLRADLEYAESAFTEDRRLSSSELQAKRFYNALGSLLDINASTTVDNAIQGNVYWETNVYQVKFGYRRVAPNYRSLGAIFLNNDIEDISAGISWRMFKQRLNASTTIGLQRNNLENKLVQESARQAYAASLNYSSTSKWNLGAQYSNFLATNRFNNQNLSANQLSLQQNTDSLLYNQVTQNAGLNASKQFGDSLVQHGLNGNANWQQARDSKDNNSDFYSGSLGYSLFLKRFKGGFNLGLLSTLNTVGGFENLLLGPTFGLNKIVSKNYRLSYQLAYSTNSVDGRSSGYNLSNRIALNARLGKHHQISADANWLLREATLQQSQEWRGGFTYNYTF